MLDAQTKDTAGMTALRGSCLCGGVRFEIDGPLMRSSHCHCRQCQKAHEHSRSAQTDPGALTLYGVALATLDDDPGLRPDAHAFIVDKAPWFTVTDDLAQYPARIPGQNTKHNS